MDLSRTLRVASAPVFVLALLFWIVALGGISAVQEFCNGDNVQCTSHWRLEWWILWFELALLLLSAAVLFGGSRLSALRPGLLGLLAAQFALLTFATTLFLDTRDNSTGSGRSRVNTCVAGYLMLTFATGLLILIVGALDGHHDATPAASKAPTNPYGAPQVPHIPQPGVTYAATAPPQA